MPPLTGVGLNRVQLVAKCFIDRRIYEFWSCPTKMIVKVVYIREKWNRERKCWNPGT